MKNKTKRYDEHTLVRFGWVIVGITELYQVKHAANFFVCSFHFYTTSIRLSVWLWVLFIYAHTYILGHYEYVCLCNTKQQNENDFSSFLVVKTVINLLVNVRRANTHTYIKRWNVCMRRVQRHDFNK